MKKVKIGNAILYHGKCEDVLPTLKNESVDTIITDPPYLYLKHKLDAPFDEELVFENWWRILNDNKLIVFFGRGDPFFRWNLMLEKLGFEFKEHVVWDKNASSNFLCNFLRIHDEIVIRAKGRGTINKCLIDYFDYSISKDRIDSIENVFRRLRSAIIGKDKELVMKYIDEGLVEFNIIMNNKSKITCRSIRKNARAVGMFKMVKNGKIETSVLRCKKEQQHYKHPTQKPVELMTRLINLASKENEVVLDPFMGGGSIPKGTSFGRRIAALKNGRKFIGIEPSQMEFLKPAKFLMYALHFNILKFTMLYNRRN